MSKNYTEESKMIELYNKYKALRGKEKRAHEKRHFAAEEDLNEYYNYSNATSVKIKKGLVHIFGEAFYKLNCLKVRTKDTPKRYVLRNRQIIGVVVAGTLVIGGVSIGKNIKQKTKDDDTQAVTSTLTDYTFNKTYKVQPGDTLTQLAEDFDVRSSDIKYANSSLEDTNLLYQGDTLKIPYTVCTDNLDEFTDIVDIGDLSVEELAKEYETDCKTLELINGDNITYDYEDKEYKTTSEQLVVPEFTQIVKKHK